MKTMRVARMIMRTIKAMRVTGVNIIITIKIRIMRMARMIMRMARMIMRTIKAMRVTAANIIITIKLRIIRIARVITIIIYKNENQCNNDDKKVILTPMMIMMTT